MRALMVQGTSSWAGKSLLATALCRHFARRGLRVAPFKGQNMSNNARVVAGGEIGTAQYLQAIAARVAPDVRMNPVLVKPEAHDRSQVILLGHANPSLSDRPWRERPPSLWPAIESSLQSLLAEFDLVVIEGAGSPAEINLLDTDLSNMRVARAADAAVLLVCDIDRGGSFAHLYGTWALLEPADRALIRAFVLNRFRGDAGLLAPGPQRLQELTGIPLAGVVPMLRHSLPDEDGAAPARSPRARAPRVAIIAYPTASNLDEFKSIEQVADVIWARRVEQLDGADLVILPGSKHVAADLAWLRLHGFATALDLRARSGRRILGVCGGLQMLGRELRDQTGRDGDAEGLDLLALRTTLEAEKRLRERTEAQFSTLEGVWQGLSEQPVAGYEIRHGRSEAIGPLSGALPEGLGWVDGPVLGVYLHGALEDPAIIRALLGAAPTMALGDAIDDLTDQVIEHLDVRLLDALVGRA